MICPNCQFENFASSSSCASCGKPFRLVRNGSLEAPAQSKPKSEAKAKTTKSQAKIKLKPEPNPKPQVTKKEPKALLAATGSDKLLNPPQQKNRSKTSSAPHKPVVKPDPTPPLEKPPFIPEPVYSPDSAPKGVSLEVRSKRTISPFRLFLFVSIAVLGVIATLMVIKPAVQKEPMPIADSSDEAAVAVLCFRNDTGEEELDSWEKGLPQAVTLDLLQSKSLKVLSSERMFHDIEKLGLWEKRQKKYTQSDLKRLASSTGATIFVMGSISRASEGYKINAVVKGASGNSLFSDSLECSGEEEIFSRQMPWLIWSEPTWRFQLIDLPRMIEIFKRSLPGRRPPSNILF